MLDRTDGAPHRDVLDHLAALGPATTLLLLARADGWTREHGVTFGAGSGRVDVGLVPRIVTAPEWSHLRRGLEQRARALESFLQDVYGPGRVLADGVLTEAEIRSRPGWRPEAHRLPPGVVRAPIIGFDVVRDEDGTWRVLEDNLRAPSGTAYALALRELMDDVAPAVPRPSRLLDPRTSLASMREALLGRHVPHGNGAVLTSGPSTAAYYEHQRLASELGFDLVVADDLAVRDGRVHALTTGTPLDALYLRLDDELADLRRADGGRVGTEILAVAADGAVVLANAPGNGVADDKAMYAVVPELIAYYLGEPALLAGVPTYRLGHPEERRMVLGRLGDLVTKPVDGYGGSGVLIGPAASAHELDQRRRDIVRDPEGWVAQEVVSLSSHPTWDGARMEPRRVDLRAFVHVRGTEPHDCRLADLALTRVAPPHGHLVNTSQGGGITDTWIVTDPGDGSR